MGRASNYDRPYPTVSRIPEGTIGYGAPSYHDVILICCCIPEDFEGVSASASGPPWHYWTKWQAYTFPQMVFVRLKLTLLVEAGGPFETESDSGNGRGGHYPLWEIFDLGYLAMLITFLAILYGLVRFLLLVPTFPYSVQFGLLVAAVLGFQTARQRYLMLR